MDAPKFIDPEEARVRDIFNRMSDTFKFSLTPVRELTDLPVCGDTLARTRDAHRRAPRHRQ